MAQGPVLANGSPGQIAADRAALVPALERHVLARFLEVVQEHPGSLAVTSEGVARTFGELAADVAELADRLRDRLVREGPDCSPVAVLAEQGVATMTAWLAVVAVGRPVTLLDPMLPPERWRQLLEQAGAGLLLVGGPWQADVPTDTVDTLPLGTVPVAPEGPSSAVDLSAVLARLTAAGWAEVDPAAAASIVFTSGSTGAAKGVVYTHRSVLAVAHFGAEALGIAPGDRVALVIPQSFAYGQEASLMTLLNGASLHASDVRRSGLSGVGNWFAEHRITVLHSTPSLLRAIVDTLADEEVLGELRVVVTGGEAARGRDLADLRRHLPGDAVVVSQLGSSEAGPTAVWRLQPGDAAPEGTVPVGRAAPLKELRILSPEGAECPPGQPGDLFVVSAYLGGGYWREPERTATKFTLLEDGRTAYSTGDRASMDESGNLRVLGRADDAVKIRGYLVEPAEVEVALTALDGVDRAVVRGRAVADQRAGGTAAAVVTELVAWVVPAPGPSPSPASLRRQLRDRLPDWMVPRFVVLLADLPVTERGKLDVAALPDPPPRPAPRPPADRWQEAVGAVWSAVLGVDQVDPAEQFIELGGDSLATEEMLTRIAEDLSVSLTMSDLAEHPSLAEFAARAAAVQDVSGTGTVSHSPTMVTLRSSGDRAPVFCFAGAATHGLAFAGLARALGPDHPVHAFHASGLTARGPIDWTIRGSARRHVRDVLRVVPAHQPIVLVGHSLGGLIALEAAHQLAAAGRQVSNLIILDAYLPPRHGGYVGEWARLRADARLGRATDAQEPAGSPPRSVWELAVHVLKTQDLQTLRTRLLLPLAGIMRFGPETTNRIFWQHSFWLSRIARPRPWPGRALVLYTDENPDDLDNWNALLTGEHEIHRVEGDHAGILRPPYLAAVGERVRCFLG